jgi:hypothetical protein
MIMHIHLYLNKSLKCFYAAFVCYSMFKVWSMFIHLLN